ncbi:MAG: hypothetical protein IJ491_01850 [Clostridia bacterium]|nr:hypothetical protein [Clostridia bacterium]
MKSLTSALNLKSVTPAQWVKNKPVIMQQNK